MGCWKGWFAGSASALLRRLARTTYGPPIGGRRPRKAGFSSVWWTPWRPWRIDARSTASSSTGRCGVANPSAIARMRQQSRGCVTWRVLTARHARSKKIQPWAESPCMLEKSVVAKSRKPLSRTPLFSVGDREKQKSRVMESVFEKVLVKAGFGGSRQILT